MMTVTGEYLTLDGGAPSLLALAQGLARMPRYAGQNNGIEWQVADHLVVCGRMAQTFIGWPDRLALHALLHDAHEAMTGDIPVPFKTPDMSRLQAELDTRIYAEFGLTPPTKVERNLIKVIDEEALLAEAFVVAPTRTYEKIIAERGHQANPVYIQIVQDWLHDDELAQDFWYGWMTDLIAFYANNPPVCDPALRIA